MRQFMMVLVVVAVTSAVGSHARAVTRDDSRSAAGQRLYEAMVADLAGDVVGRREALARAIELNPGDETIRWQSGYVRGADGNWYTIEQFCERQKADPKLEMYREKRRQSGGTLAEHRALARWCMRNDLPLQERFHWLAVLEWEPANKTARKRLGLGNYNGLGLTHQQVTELKSQSRTWQRQLKKWRPLAKRWLKELQSNSTTRRMAAMEAIREVRDPASIPALVAVLDVAGNQRRDRRTVIQPRRDNVDQVALRAAEALVAAMGNIPEHDATLVLVDQALFSPWREVRQSATNHLKQRRLTDFVPMLVGNLCVVDTSTFAELGLAGWSSGGRLFIETYDATYSLDYSRWVVPETFAQAGVGPAEMAQDEAEVRRIESAARDWSMRARIGNPRIETILAQVGGEQYTGGPRACWDAWRDYNELGKPVYKPEYSYTATAARYAPRTCECFVAGTPVWTLTGLRPIESIVAGDQVLAQNLETGELTYQCVSDTTYRAPNPTVRVGVGNETITATRGHRFWESGQGWQMAKFLEPGMRLSTTAGSLPIKTIEAGEEEAAFNLVVDGFHTYFVGESRLLVHDNGCPQPTLSVLPGWRAKSLER